MKKIAYLTVSFIAAAVMILIGLAAFFTQPKANAATECAGSLVMEYDTGTVLSEKNADEKRPIASMVKIMTLLLSWEAVDSGRITLDQQVQISPNAASMGGSQMFLESGDTYTVSDLIKGITVVSANDASVQMAELLSGSVESFVEQMNQRAKDLGMNNTKFANCTGLPDEKEQYSTARDVSIMMRQLLSHDGYYGFSRIYMENFNHPDGRITEFVNTNKLVRFYKDCDGGKTGFTNEAMFCLSATAKRNGMRVIATVLGSPDSKTRFKEITGLFNDAFANYSVQTVVEKKPIENNIAVENGKSSAIAVEPKEEIKLLLDKNKRNGLKVELEIEEKLIAPIAIGQKVGILRVVDENGTVLGETELVSLTEIAKLTYWDALLKTLSNWQILRK